MTCPPVLMSALDPSPPAFPINVFFFFLPEANCDWLIKIITEIAETNQLRMFVVQICSLKMCVSGL